MLPRRQRLRKPAERGAELISPSFPSCPCTPSPSMPKFVCSPVVVWSGVSFQKKGGGEGKRRLKDVMFLPPFFLLFFLTFPILAVSYGGISFVSVFPRWHERKGGNTGRKGFRSCGSMGLLSFSCSLFFFRPRLQDSAPFFLFPIFFHKIHSLLVEIPPPVGVTVVDPPFSLRIHLHPNIQRCDAMRRDAM